MGRNLRRSQNEQMIEIFGTSINSMRNLPIPKVCLQKVPNQQLFLYQGFLELIDNDKIIEGKGIVKLTWHPSPRISIKFIYDRNDGDIDLESENLYIKLTEKLPQQRLHITYNRWFSQGNRAELHGYIAERSVHGYTKELASVVFHIPNFYDLDVSNQTVFDENDNEIEFEDWLDFGNPLIFDHGGWHIVLGCLDTCYDLNELLYEQGGYALTHICKIERLDEKKFDLDEAHKQIEAFCYYLSLIRGLWIPPILVSGFNENGEQVCEEWCNPQIRGDSWEKSTHFFDYIDSLEVVFCFPEFWNKWQDQDWKGVIKNVFQWYIESLKDATSPQTSLILIQASLEKMAWIHLANNDCLTGENFKKITAADQIRLFLRFLKIEILPFAKDSELSRMEKEFNWKNTIQAAVEIRNLVVHPPVKSNQKTSVSEEVMKEAVVILREYLRKALIQLFEEEAVTENRDTEID